MLHSSYDQLQKWLRSWPFGPAAAIFYIDLHDIRGLNRSLGPKSADAVIQAVGGTTGATRREAPDLSRTAAAHKLGLISSRDFYASPEMQMDLEKSIGLLN